MYTINVVVVALFILYDYVLTNNHYNTYSIVQK